MLIKSLKFIIILKNYLKFNSNVMNLILIYNINFNCIVPGFTRN